MDSTAIMSNMKILNRLELFIRTIECFLANLKRERKASYRKLPEHFKERYMERAGYFAYPKSSDARRNLEKCALDLCYLVNQFRVSKKIRNWKTYMNMKRLLNEQVEIRKGESNQVTVWFHEPRNPEQSKEAPGEVALKSPDKIDGEALQNPSDPDATYSGHKGAGYKVDLSETCDKKNPFQVIDYVEVGKVNESDQKSADKIHSDLKQRGHKPKTSYADSNFVSGDNLIKSKDSGIDLKGPVPGEKPKNNIQKRLGEFQYDEEFKKVKSCPAGHKPVEQNYDEETETLEAKFDNEKCEKCSFNKEFPLRKIGAFRILKIKRSKAATAHRRLEQDTKEFKEQYKIRSGIESTFSHLKNDRGMGRLRVRGSPSVILRVVFKAMGENISRLMRCVLKLIKKPRLAPRIAHA